MGSTYFTVLFGRKLACVFAVVLMASLLASGIAYAASFTGTRGDDNIRGTADRDEIYGLGGDDELRGLRGQDEIYGGSGKDEIYGGTFPDEIYGGSGNDEIFGQKGNDYINGGTGRDNINGNAGNDYINSADDGGIDIVDCGGGENDRVVADDGDSVLANCETLNGEPNP